MTKQRRPYLEFVRQLFGDAPLVGCEVGVAFGENAEYMLQLLNLERLYLVDIDVDRFWHLNRQQGITIIHKPSVLAAGRVREPLDFVYIDATHDYENVMADCRTWFPKLGPTGRIGGHDYYKGFQGVIDAVNDFSREVGLEVKHDVWDWWLVRGEEL